jgi:hypothetical protein
MRWARDWLLPGALHAHVHAHAPPHAHVRCQPPLTTHSDTHTVRQGLRVRLQGQVPLPQGARALSSRGEQTRTRSTSECPVLDRPPLSSLSPHATTTLAPQYHCEH